MTTFATSSPSNSTIVRIINSRIALKSIPRLLARTRMRVVSALAPRWALQTALDQFITPPRFEHSAAEKSLLADAEAITVATRFGRIAAWRIGDASRPAVLMSHGWGGRGAQFRAFVPALQEAGYQVVLFDHHGHGMSEGRQASLIDFWRGLEAVWDHLSDRGIVVTGMVAHSLGGAAVGSALRRSLTRRHRDAPLPRVVMLAPPASLIRYSHLFARWLGISEQVRSAMQWRIEQRFGVDWEEFELPQSVATIRAPALFIHDRDDRETRFESGLALARAWPDARFHATHGLGHRRILRNSEVIHRTVDFLSDRVEFLHPPAAHERSSHLEPSPLY